MTRAEEELYLCGTKTKKNLSEGCWYQMFEQTLKPLLREEIAENIPLPQAREEEDTPALSLPTPPLWLHQPAPEEPLPPKPLTPSRPSAPDPEGDAPVFAAAAMQRGKLIHLLLETLPDVSPDLWEDSAHILLQKYWPQGGTTEKHTLMREVLAILQHPDFSEVFKPGSQAEVAITGIVADENGQPRILSGQIDRLRILPNKILLVDYKTNYNPPNSAAQIPPSYLQQMQAYTKALRAIYPHHSIEAAILWTHTPSLMAV
jgi:ATP-dependent helicase/nuclease subunit A